MTFSVLLGVGRLAQGHSLGWPLARRSIMWRLNVSCLGSQIKRALTQHETATALRPFYFSVHPDLFGKFPKERDVNENSLKLLNEHMSNLATSESPVKHQSLVFYIRNSQRNTRTGDFDIVPITISLQSKDIRSTVSSILKASNLSLDYVKSIKPRDPAGGPDRPLRWHHSYYEHTGKANPDVHKRKPVQTLSMWLRKNVGAAKQLMESAKPVVKETEIFKQELCEAYKLKDIIWESSWGISSFYGCMKTFGRLGEELKEKGAVEKLRGRTVIFSNTTGITVLGDIMLSSEDVPQDWARLLKSDRNYDQIISQFQGLEKQLSAMLCNIQVVRRRYNSTIMADRYLRQLQRMIYNLQCDTTGVVTGDLRGLQLVIEGSAGPLTVSPRGQILVPNSCPGFLVKNFIQQKKDEAAIILLEYYRNQEEEYHLRERCIDDLELLSLKKDDHIMSEQMIDCCKRLMRDPRDLGVSVKNMKIRISQYYTLMQDGELIIPWNWKGPS